MNELMFIILVMIGGDENTVNIKSPKVSFDTLEKCEKARIEIFKDVGDALKRSVCAVVMPSSDGPAKDVVAPPEEVKVVPCVQPPSSWYIAGKPCLKA